MGVSVLTCNGHQSHESQTSPPANKELQTAWPGKREKFREFFFLFALKSCSACGLSTAIFHEIFAQFFTVFFHVLFRPFFTICFFAHFSHFLSLFSSHIFFRTSDSAHFSYHIFQRCAAEKVLYNVQPLHCITVPRQVIPLLVDHACHS